MALRPLTFPLLQHLQQVAALLDDFILTHLLPHSKVPQVRQSKASHLLPGVSVGPQNP